MEQNKLIAEIEKLRDAFDTTTTQVVKDLKRQEKIMVRSDQRQKREYDELQQKLEEIKLLNREIEDTQKEVLLTMGAIGESRSRETYNHVRRVAEYSKLFGLKLGMTEEEAEMLKIASPMHDIGKVGIPDAILNKPGKLTNEEFEVMKTHATLGYEMLKISERPLLKAAAIIAHEHHEKYDGTGYPRKLKGEEIHIYGRITSIADVFDALGSKRCYKDAWDDERIYALFREQSGKQFDPKLLEIFFADLDDFLAIREEFRDVIEE
ncbi:MAG: HD-GYP domain-containing protein [Pseudomonadales bacterium]